MNYQRVYVIGGAGSGKSTLAKVYAEKHSIPHHQLDDFYYEHAARRQRRTKADRQQRLLNAVGDDAWVIEGIFWQSWIEPALERADKIIVLDIPEWTRQVRVIKRHFQLLRHAKASEWPTFLPTLLELVKHNRRYISGPLQETLKVLAAHDSKVSVCKSNQEAERELVS